MRVYVGATKHQAIIEIESLSTRPMPDEVWEALSRLSLRDLAALEVWLLYCIRHSVFGEGSDVH